MLPNYLGRNLQWDTSGGALHRSLSPGFGALMGVVLLPGLGIPLAALAGFLGSRLIGATAEEGPPAGWRTWLEAN